jgi:hypothetical protein
MTTFNDQVFQMGGAPVAIMAGIPFGPASKAFYVDPLNGSNDFDGMTPATAKSTVQAAFDLCTTLHNDVVFMLAAGTSATSAAAITWSKDFTHLIGINSGGPEPRSRVKCGAALATTPFITWSGDGCVVMNVSFWHETSDAAGLVNVSVTGDRNTFVGCQFAGGLGSGNAVTGARSLQVGGSGNTFKRCVIGCDTITAVNGQAGAELIAGTNSACMHATFEDCDFVVSTNGTTYAHIISAAAAGVGRFNKIVRCIFVNEGSGAQAQAITIAAQLPVSSYIYLIDSWMYGCPEWNLTNYGLVMNSTIAANTTGVATGNLMVITS